jgi:hypothetical protein
MGAPLQGNGIEPAARKAYHFDKQILIYFLQLSILDFSAWKNLASPHPFSQIKIPDLPPRLSQPFTSHIIQS